MTNFSKAMRVSVAGAFLATSTLMPIQAHAQGQLADRVNCQGADGCVLPLTPAVEEGGIGWLLPVLVGLGAIIGAIVLLSDDDDDVDTPVSI